MITEKRKLFFFFSYAYFQAEQLSYTLNVSRNFLAVRHGKLTAVWCSWTWI